MDEKKTSNRLRKRYILGILLLVALLIYNGIDLFHKNYTSPSIKKWLAEHSIDVDVHPARLDIKRKDNKNLTLMQLAAADGRVDVMKWLNRKGVEVKFSSKTYIDSEDLMYIAAKNGHLDVINWLKWKGFDLNLAMIAAAEKGNLDLMKRLKRKSASVKGGKSKHNYTPMHAAASGGHLEVIKWLKDQGADINAKHTRGMHISYVYVEGMKHQHTMIVRNITPLDRARDKEVINWLKENGGIPGDYKYPCCEN